MNPPKCKVCGWEHWANAPHYTGTIMKGLREPLSAHHAEAVAAITKVLVETDAITMVSPPKVKRPRGRPISDAPKSPRAEYQRELMRKRRAAAKEAQK